jgi:hypothetical protein
MRFSNLTNHITPHTASERPADHQVIMKHILTITILAAAALIARADDGPAGGKVKDGSGSVADKTKEVAHEAKDAVIDAAHRADIAVRAAWVKTQAYFSEETPVYRGGASTTLAGLAKEIAEVKERTPETAPAYFRTRLKALDEEQEHLAKSLALLSPEDLKDRASGPRHNFDQCVGDLEKAIDQAKEGVDTLSKGK